MSFFGLIFTIGLVVCYLSVKARISTKKCAIITSESVNQSFFYGTICAVFGGHFGYLFINYSELLTVAPLLFFMPWIGGFSLPIALMSAALAIVICQKKQLANSIMMSDFIVLSLPIVVFALQLPLYLAQSSQSSANAHLAIDELLIFGSAYFVVWAVTYFIAKQQQKLGSATGCFLIALAVVQVIMQFTLLKAANGNSELANNAAFIHISAEIWLNIFMLVTGIAILYWGYVNHANSLIAEKN